MKVHAINVSMTTKQQIIDQLDQLPSWAQTDVLTYITRLRANDVTSPRGLLDMAGSISKQDAASLTQAIEESRRIDEQEW